MGIAELICELQLAVMTEFGGVGVRVVDIGGQVNYLQELNPVCITCTCMYLQDYGVGVGVSS